MKMNLLYSELIILIEIKLKFGPDKHFEILKSLGAPNRPTGVYNFLLNFLGRCIIYNSEVQFYNTADKALMKV